MNVSVDMPEPARDALIIFPIAMNDGIQYTSTLGAAWASGRVNLIGEHTERGVLDDLARGREYFTTYEWKQFLLQSIGFEPSRLSTRAQDILLLKMIPFVERNYNMVELGPRGTGKSHLFQRVSPYSHLISGGKATVARMFVNNSTGQRGLVCQ